MFAKPLSATDADAAYEAGQRVVETHQRLSAFLEPGQTLAQIDRFVAQTLGELKCKSCFLGYRVPRLPAFPSHACLSVNDCVVHGTAAYLTRPLVEGDLLKIDIGVTHKGWIGDAAWTYSFGEPEPEIKRLMNAGKESLRQGIEQFRPGNTYMAWAETVERVVEHDFGFHLVKGLGGHGYGRKLHAAPFISNTVPVYRGEWPDGNKPCAPGTLLAVEPMIAIGTGATNQGDGQWPIFSADGSMTVHYEHDVLITEDGQRVMTEGLENTPDVIK